MLDTAITLSMLSSWSQAAEKYWYSLPGRPDLGCYGTGYNGWGVQTNQKYMSAMALLAARGGRETQSLAYERALASLRYSLATHVSGDTKRTDGSQWGHTWISSLGIERMMFGVYLLQDVMTDADMAAMDRVLASEADWISTCYPVHACKWASRGPNKPESNLWNGAVCWRAAMHNPAHPNVELWKENARSFLINSVSVPEDVGAVARNIGDANFFSNYALDHHAYLNVGYMVICISNAAMLHFDMKSRGWECPPELLHHQRDLWQVIRKMLFSDGRLCRIGGDTRVRYAYCQDYLLPSLLFAAEKLGEEHSGSLLSGQMEFVCKEFDYNANGSFYGKRLGPIADVNPLYYPRLESDRAGVLAMALRYAELLDDDAPATGGHRTDETVTGFENSVSGPWSESHYGAAMHRSSHRIASFTWHSKYNDQPVGMGLCTPPDDGHMAEWSRNLAGMVQLCHNPYYRDRPDHKASEVTRHWTDTFEGGFVTCGEIIEGKGVELAEGWRGTDLISHRLAFAALPDGHSVIGLQYCRPANVRCYIQEALGMNLSIPNDIFNDFSRDLQGSFGTLEVSSPPENGELISLKSNWVNIDQRIGAIGLYGSDSMYLKRHNERSDGRYKSLYIERLAWSARQGPFAIDSGESLFDIGWMCVSGLDSKATAELAQANTNTYIDTQVDELRAVKIKACDGREYVVIANFSDITHRYEAPQAFKAIGGCHGEIPPLCVAIYCK